MGTEPHSTDGTAAGTTTVADLAPGTSSSAPGDLALHVDLALPIVNLGAVTSTSWSSNLPIPNDMGLVGGRVTAQSFFVLGSPILAESSEAVSLVIGD